jgi:hypothetical protein
VFERIVVSPVEAPREGAEVSTVRSLVSDGNRRFSDFV